MAEHPALLVEGIGTPHGVILRHARSRKPNMETYPWPGGHSCTHVASLWLLDCVAGRAWEVPRCDLAIDVHVTPWEVFNYTGTSAVARDYGVRFLVLDVASLADALCCGSRNKVDNKALISLSV